MRNELKNVLVEGLVKLLNKGKKKDFTQKIAGQSGRPGVVQGRNKLQGKGYNDRRDAHAANRGKKTKGVMEAALIEGLTKQINKAKKNSMQGSEPKDKTAFRAANKQNITPKANAMGHAALTGAAAMRQSGKKSTAKLFLKASKRHRTGQDFTAQENIDLNSNDEELLNEFAAFCEQEGIDVGALNEEQIDEIFGALKKMGGAAATGFAGAKKIIGNGITKTADAMGKGAEQGWNKNVNAGHTGAKGLFRKTGGAVKGMAKETGKGALSGAKKLGLGALKTGSSMIKAGLAAKSSGGKIDPMAKVRQNRADRGRVSAAAFAHKTKGTIPNFKGPTSTVNGPDSTKYNVPSGISKEVQFRKDRGYSKYGDSTELFGDGIHESREAFKNTLLTVVSKLLFEGRDDTETDSDSIKNAGGDSDTYAKLKASKQQSTDDKADVKGLALKHKIEPSKKTGKITRGSFRKEILGNRDGGKFDKKGKPAATLKKGGNSKFSKGDKSKPFPLKIKGKPNPGKKVLNVRAKSVHTSRSTGQEGAKAQANSDAFSKLYSKLSTSKKQ